MVIDDKFALLSNGELNVTGRLVDASNATLYAKVRHEDQSMLCIYKPIAGERPLWDFPDGALAYREYAAYLLSSTLGFNIVPITILRDGPYGFGMVQEWIDIDESVDLASFFSSNNPALRSMALFDAIINNTDRKIGHLLPTTTGDLFGCDHGVTFHSEDKLRTVLWQWSGDPLTKSEIELLQRARHLISSELDLSPYLSVTELLALSSRIDTLMSKGAMPVPNPDWPPVPWPAF
ncbi:MAG: SCO1664 family protein [Candidatus Planktophila sp.]|nr:SCO1664 family protein [Candidatus Planktophila sp.]MSO64183.1 SCO1664 family protein [Candidatus Planktophila sp.]